MSRRRRDAFLHALAGIAALIVAVGAVAGECGCREMLVSLVMNGQAVGVDRVLRADDGDFLFSDDLMQRLRIAPSTAPEVEHGGHPYWRARAGLGVHLAFDEALGELAITLEPSRLSTERVDVGAPAASPVVGARPGAYVNYDAFVAHDTIGRLSGVQTEFGAFAGAGLLNSSFITLQGSAPGAASGTRRLESTLAFDDPSSMRTVRFGDTINGPGQWGRAIRYGGVQVATNFSTQPYFVTLPVQRASGVAALPSVVDVFVGNALVAQRSVPAGPYEFDRVPIVTGSGEMRVVTRDITGREQVVLQPFNVTPLMLRSGLDDVSFDAGAVRRDYAIRSDRYGAGFASGTWRRGLTDGLTGEARLEKTHDTTTTGLGLIVAAPGAVTANGAWVASRAPTGSGELAQVGVDHIGRIGFGVHGEFVSRHFTSLGRDPAQALERRVLTANLGLPMRGSDALGVAYVDQSYYDVPNVRIATLTYTVALAERGSLTASIARVSSTERSTVFSLVYSIALDASRSASLTWRQQGGRSDAAATLQSALPSGTGAGWTVTATRRGDGNASGQWQNESIALNADVRHTQGDDATRIGAAGAFVAFGGNLYASRPIDASFALVRAPGAPNTRVLVDQRDIGRTDANGDLLVPRVRAYERNPIALDVRDLPLDAEVQQLDAEVVPRARAGVIADFRIARTKNASVRIVLDDGAPLPPTASVRLRGALQSVGLDGEVYVRDLHGHDDRLEIDTASTHCRVALPDLPADRAQPRLPAQRCVKVVP